MKLTLARKRLLLGSSNVGIVIVLSFILLLFGAPQLLFIDQGISPLSDILALTIFFFTFAVLQSGFDLIGATACERDDINLDLTVIFKNLLRGIVIHSSVLAGSALLIYISANIFGKYGVLFVLYALFYLLSKYKIQITKLICPEILFEQATDKQIVVASNQPSFHGGIYDNKDLFSKNLLSILTDEEALILHKRRVLIIQNGAAKLSERYAAGILLIGAFLGMFVLGINPETVAGIAEFALWNSMWSFICLLVLPTGDRQAVFKADRLILEAGVEKSVFESALKKQDTLFDDEKVRTRLIEKIFHPIPMLEDRLLKIQNFDSVELGNNPALPIIPGAPWHILRHSLYLSWGSLNLISRSVHCSIGRPECWVFLPVE